MYMVWPTTPPWLEKLSGCDACDEMDCGGCIENCPLLPTVETEEIDE
jgi:predicted aldo/keto reductase-like oxidoreductase